MTDPKPMTPEERVKLIQEKGSDYYTILEHICAAVEEAQYARDRHWITLVAQQAVKDEKAQRALILAAVSRTEERVRRVVSLPCTCELHIGLVPCERCAALDSICFTISRHPVTTSSA